VYSPTLSLLSLYAPTVAPYGIPISLPTYGYIPTPYPYPYYLLIGGIPLYPHTPIPLYLKN